jgi:hypothetical protein
MQRAGELVEIKTFTGKKTLMNAVALVLHTLLYGARGIYLCVLMISTVWGEEGVRESSLSTVSLDPFVVALMEKFLA